MSDEPASLHPKVAGYQQVNTSLDVTSKPYDPFEAAQRIREAFGYRAVRKLSFAEQCSIQYGGFNGCPHGALAEAFGVTKTTVSQICGCVRSEPRMPDWRFETNPKTLDSVMVETPIKPRRSPNRLPRYQRVAAEWTRLGEQAFGERYFPRELANRIWRIAARQKTERGQ